MLKSSALMISTRLTQSVRKLPSKKAKISLLTWNAWNTSLRLIRIVGHAFASSLMRTTGKSRDATDDLSYEYLLFLKETYYFSPKTWVLVVVARNMGVLWVGRKWRCCIKLSCPVQKLWSFNSSLSCSQVTLWCLFATKSMQIILFELKYYFMDHYPLKNLHFYTFN